MRLGLISLWVVLASLACAAATFGVFTSELPLGVVGILFLVWMSLLIYAFITHRWRALPLLLTVAVILAFPAFTIFALLECGRTNNCF